jgi:hypothetical protein
MSDFAFLHNASLDTPVILIRRESNYGIDGIGAISSLSALLLGLGNG